MLQRVQTLFLLAVVLLMACLFFVPYAAYTGASQGLEFTVMGMSPVDAQGEMLPQGRMLVWQLAVLTGFVGLGALLTIGLFRRRLLQIRLCAVNIVLLLGLQVLMPLMASAMAHQQLQTVEGNVWHLPTVFPVVGAILMFLALRAIGRDEALVRSLDRLR